MTKKKYQPLTIPRLSWEKETLTSSFGRLIAQPLEPDFGMTLGNALRRALLGGVEGSAVVAVIIDGVNNEFSLLEGVVEDTMQVLLNIKGIVVRNTTGEPGRMRLSVTGEATALAIDIQADEHLEIVNTEHVIAHVAQGGTLTIDFFVDSGRGYQPAQWPAGKALQEDNKIYIDALFSPVRKVTFGVEKTRVGRDIDYDKLILDVWTDGSETPVDVVHYAVSVLRTQLEHFLLATEIPFNEISALPEEETQERQTPSDETPLKGLPLDLLLKPIDELELSVRAHNCLMNAGIKTIRDLVNLSEEEALKIKNFGKKSYDEVVKSMEPYGLSFGMNIKEEDVKKALEIRDKETDHETSKR